MISAILYGNRRNGNYRLVTMPILNPRLLLDKKAILYSAVGTKGNHIQAITVLNFHAIMGNTTRVVSAVTCVLPEDVSA